MATKRADNTKTVAAEAQSKAGAEKGVTRNGAKIHAIVKYPDPVLAKRGEPVTVFDAALKKLVAEMFESMYAAQGIGLAAPQIGLSQRLTVIDTRSRRPPRTSWC